jgi:hypothetical protein
MSKPPNINALRARIADLNEECQRLEQTTCSLAEAVALVQARARELAAKGARTLAHAVRYVAQGYPIEFRDFSLKGGELAGVLAAIAGADRFAEVLLTHVKLPAEDVPDADARARRRAEVRAELDTLEAEEERLVLASLGTSHPIARRADVRPEVILGLPL